MASPRKKHLTRRKNKGKKAGQNRRKAERAALRKAQAEKKDIL